MQSRVEILCVPLQRFCIKLNPTFACLPTCTCTSLGCFQPRHLWAGGLMTALHFPFCARRAESNPGAPQGSEPRRQALLFLESDNTMRKALNGERRKRRSARAVLRRNPAPRMDGTGGLSRSPRRGRCQSALPAGGVCQRPSPVHNGVFVFGENTLGSPAGVSGGMRISSPGKGDKAPVFCFASKLAASSVAGLCFVAQRFVFDPSQWNKS